MLLICQKTLKTAYLYIDNVQVAIATQSLTFNVAILSHINQN